MQFGEVGGRSSLPLTHPGILPQGHPEAVGCHIAAPGDQVQVPSPVLVRDRTDEHLFCMFLLLWGSMGGTQVNTGRTCKLHTEKGPGTSPDMLHDAGLEPTTFLL